MVAVDVLRGRVLRYVGGDMVAGVHAQMSAPWDKSYLSIAYNAAYRMPCTS